MLAPLLNPSSIAVVGVSLDPDKVGHQIFVNLTSFPGAVYPVNPKHKKILGKTCYENLLSIPGEVELAIIVTPAPTVEAIIDQCIDKKVKAVIIISSGFAESGQSGKLLQDRIETKLAEHHILLLGPNTLGVINPRAKLNASFAPRLIRPGNIALISQSGATLTAIFSEFESRKVGCSFALSLGNKAGFSEIEALSHAARDPNTKVIALYLESLTDARAFMSLAKKISLKKPIILLKGGVSEAGRQASLSHTAALATNAVLLKEASFQIGYTLVDTIEQFFESIFFVDAVLSRAAKLPENLMILTNAGGPAVNACDLADAAHLTFATWSKESRQKFARELPRVNPSNPTDLLGDASVSDIRLALEFIEEDPKIDSSLLIITPQAVTDIPGITEMLLNFSYKKTLVVSLMGGEGQHAFVVSLREAGIPTTEYANEGIELYATLSHINRAATVDRSQVLMKQLEAVIGESEPKKIVERRRVPLRAGELEETYILLENYGFVLPRCAIVSSLTEVEKIGALDPNRVFPLIAKTANLKLKHKAVVGGVVKNISSLAEARTAYQKLSKFGSRVLFQEVITDATELILGGKRDPSFGPFLAVGLGGSLTNILADRAYVFLPASGREIRWCFARTKASQSLTNTQRGFVTIAMEKLARIFREHQEIIELEINPLMITKDQILVADVKVAL